MTDSGLIRESWSAHNCLNTYTHSHPPTPPPRPLALTHFHVSLTTSGQMAAYLIRELGFKRRCRADHLKSTSPLTYFLLTLSTVIFLSSAFFLYYTLWELHNTSTCRNPSLHTVGRKRLWGSKCLTLDFFHWSQHSELTRCQS